MHILVDSMLTWCLLVGEAQVCGSFGIEADQAGKPARWTVGKSNDIIPHISSASLGAHQRDRVHFRRGAPPMYVITACCNNTWDVKTNHIWWTMRFTACSFGFVLIYRITSISNWYNEKYNPVSDEMFAICLLPWTFSNRKWVSSHTQRFFDKIPTSNPTPSSLTNMHASQWCWMHYLERENDLWGMMHKYKSCWCKVLHEENIFGVNSSFEKKVKQNHVFHQRNTFFK